MHVIRNRLNGQYATGHWFVRGSKRAWCDLEAARLYPCPDEARREMLANAYAGTCEVVELAPDSVLKRCVTALRRFIPTRRPATLNGPQKT